MHQKIIFGYLDSYLKLSKQGPAAKTSRLAVCPEVPMVPGLVTDALLSVQMKDKTLDPMMSDVDV